MGRDGEEVLYCRLGFALIKYVRKAVAKERSRSVPAV